MIEWNIPVHIIHPFISMSDRLGLFPHKSVSTTVWDLEDDKCVGVLEGHSPHVASAEINDAGDAAVIIAGPPGSTYVASIWNLGTMQCTANLTSTGQLSSLLRDRLLLGSRDDATIKLWDIGGTAPVALFDLRADAPSNRVNSIWSLTASDTSSVALTGYFRTPAHLWDLRTGQRVRLLQGHTWAVTAVSMDSACRTAVTGSWDKTVKLWDLGSGRCMDTYHFGPEVKYVMMHESGGSFLVVGEELVFKAWTTALGSSSSPIYDVDLSSSSKSECEPTVVASRDLSRVGICCQNPEGNRLEVSVWK